MQQFEELDDPIEPDLLVVKDDPNDETTKNYYRVRNRKLSVLIDEPLMPGQTRMRVRAPVRVAEIESRSEARMTPRRGRLGTVGEDLNDTMQEPLL